MRHKSITVVAGLVILLSATFARGWQEEKVVHQATLKADLTKLQGTWESTRRVGGRTVRSVKTIQGSQTRLVRFDPNGEIYWAHRSEFKLSISSRAKIFTFFNLEVTAGRSKGEKVEKPCSFIYQVDDDTFSEAHGFLMGEEDGEPRVAVWRRVKAKETGNKVVTAAK